MKKQAKLSESEEILAFKKERILQNDPTMKVLRLYGFGFFDKDIFVLCEAMKQNDYIEEVDLSRNEIGDEGIAEVVDALPNITKLNISDNSVGDEGAKAIARLKHLKELDINWNQVADEGALALSKHKRLERIRLARNHLTDQGMKYLVENTQCFLICVDDCDKASRNNWARVAAVCEYNRKMRDIKLLPGQEGAIKETREEYVENHWKEHYKNPEIQWSIYDLMRWANEAADELFPDKNIEIKPIEWKL